MTVAQIRKKSELNEVLNALDILNIEYATSAHTLRDFKDKAIRLYALKDNGTIIAICSVVPDTKYNYSAIKRLVILDPANRGKGYAKRLVSTIIRRKNENYGCTPWEDNKPMQKMLASLGFEYQYNFNDFWTFWKKSA